MLDVSINGQAFSVRWKQRVFSLTLWIFKRVTSSVCEGSNKKRMFISVSFSFSSFKSLDFWCKRTFGTRTWMITVTAMCYLGPLHHTAGGGDAQPFLKLHVQPYIPFFCFSILQHTSHRGSCCDVVVSSVFEGAVNMRLVITNQRGENESFLFYFCFQISVV